MGAFGGLRGSSILAERAYRAETDLDWIIRMLLPGSWLGLGGSRGGMKIKHTHTQEDPSFARVMVEMHKAPSSCPFCTPSRCAYGCNVFALESAKTYTSSSLCRLRSRVGSAGGVSLVAGMTQMLFSMRRQAGRLGDVN